MNNETKIRPAWDLKQRVREKKGEQTHHAHVVFLVLRQLVYGIQTTELLLQGVFTVIFFQKLYKTRASTFRNNAQP